MARETSSGEKQRRPKSSVFLGVQKSRGHTPMRLWAPRIASSVPRDVASAHSLRPFPGHRPRLPTHHGGRATPAVLSRLLQARGSGSRPPRGKHPPPAKGPIPKPAHESLCAGSNRRITPRLPLRRSVSQSASRSVSRSVSQPASQPASQQPSPSPPPPLWEKLALLLEPAGSLFNLFGSSSLRPPHERDLKAPRGTLRYHVGLL